MMLQLNLKKKEILQIMDILRSLYKIMVVDVLNFKEIVKHLVILNKALM